METMENNDPVKKPGRLVDACWLPILGPHNLDARCSWMLNSQSFLYGIWMLLDIWRVSGKKDFQAKWPCKADNESTSSTNFLQKNIALIQQPKNGKSSIPQLGADGFLKSTTEKGWRMCLEKFLVTRAADYPASPCQSIRKKLFTWPLNMLMESNDSWNVKELFLTNTWLEFNPFQYPS